MSVKHGLSQKRDKVILEHGAEENIWILEMEETVG
jgi:hypothetical protein